MPISSMKKILLTFMCTIALMLSAQHVAAQEIKMSDDGLTCTYTKADPNAASAVTVATNEPIYRAGNTYILGKQTMDKYQYAAYLRNTCPAAYAKFHTGYTLSSVGWGLLAGGLALELGSAIMWWYRPNSYYGHYAAVNNFVGGLGHTLTVASVPLLIIGYCKQHNSVGVYNSSIGQPYFSLNASQDGVGIAYHF